MKQILTSMKDVAVSRLKNPILGAFAFCWMTLNIKGISLFFLSNTEEKRAIVQGWQPTIISDLIYPAALTACYLLVLPWLHLAYQAIDEGLITRIRQSIKNKALTTYYRELRSVNIQKIDSNEQYIASLKEANVADWPEEKKRLNAIVNRERETYAKKVGELSEIEKRVTPKLEEAARTRHMLMEYNRALALTRKAMKNSGSNNDELSEWEHTVLTEVQKDIESMIKGQVFNFNILKRYQKSGIFVYQPIMRDTHSKEAINGTALQND
ncbi:hypothetical protein ACSG5T_004021 [Vibrio alginolyticus]|uniref:hypothetical protein n=1 Tax=Vibrio campbellii TaxID=680 RepID=UPI003CE51967